MSNISKQIKRVAQEGLKSTYQKVMVPKSGEKNILFIVGSQRSGTTMLSDIFDKDLNIKVYREVSKLSTKHHTKRRLDSFDSVAKEINKNRVKSIVAKPLVESQNIDKLLAYFENAKALWVFRDYKDIVASNLKKFGDRNGINNLKHIYEKTPNNYRSDRVSDQTYEIISRYYSEDMSPWDAAALSWYARNILFFERALEGYPRVRMCKYEDLVAAPEKTMHSIYSFMGADFPKKKIFSEVHQGSVRKGNQVQLSPEVEALCQKMLEQLDAVYGKQQN